MEDIVIKQYYCNKDDISSIFVSRHVFSKKISEDVSQIINDVKDLKDQKLFEYREKFDNIAKNEIIVLNAKDIEERIKNANIDKNLEKALKKAANRIREYHLLQNIEDHKPTVTITKGAKLGWKYAPIDKVAVYVPGGKASYPSTVLMCAIPANVANVGEVIMCTPNIDNPLILLAAKLAGIKKIYWMGGAHAIAALAYGTESVEKVNMIVGPGNMYVAEAKKQIYGDIGIDMVAGPSEVLIIADETANPKFIAADMLAQAEHDEHAASYLVITDESIIQKVTAYIKEYAVQNPARYQIIKNSLNNNAAFLIVNDIKEAVEISNLIAPEHLELLISSQNVPECIRKINNAGAIFVGEYSPEVVGDYIAGPSHCLPTSGAAKFSSVLSTSTFLKRISLIEYNKEAFDDVKEDIKRLAESEGLFSHAFSSVVRED